MTAAPTSGFLSPESKRAVYPIQHIPCTARAHTDFKEKAAIARRASIRWEITRRELKLGRVDRFAIGSVAEAAVGLAVDGVVDDMD